MRRSDGIMSTKYSCSVPDTDIIPKEGSVDKPIRKRSKASKNAPTTLLNANTTNFRALVQKFTGCRSAGAYKGPITLNFAVPHNDFNVTSTTSLLGCNYYTQKTHEQRQSYQHQQEDEKFHEDQGGFSSYDTDVVSEDAFVSTFSNPTSKELTLDDFDFDNILFRELPGDYSSAGTMVNDDFGGY
ncbi:uncharacterized protein LOC111408299 [Olea europaea var. sylvestris]|uniref:uncharacterized protein LOC111408299 n=1 Tax=Olea europaea var. sylvestris TaxID=158386 RepID=UPI000C1D5E72|nr:uncharacterized protein LOC111408299 [Olea europaea var. sylvestris]